MINKYENDNVGEGNDHILVSFGKVVTLARLARDYKSGKIQKLEEEKALTQGDCKSPTEVCFFQ